MGDWNWSGHSIWLFMIFGLQLGLRSLASSDSACDLTTEFSCKGNPSVCIALSRIRDGSRDCPDGSDEECNIEEEFQCQTILQCIPKERYHDGWPDCDDGSDEECGRGQHRCLCGLPHCVDGHKVKDGVKDCEDGSDEADNRTKVSPCPDESKLQDLLAVEKKRKKRQLDYTGRKVSSSGSKDEMPLDSASLRRIQERFQYSYTKFLSDRQAQTDYTSPRQLKSNEFEETSSRTTELFQGTENSPQKPYRVSTETELYGSLMSGKIYQTAVSEPTSVIPTAAFTVIKFDHDLANKRVHAKKVMEKSSKKVNAAKQQPKQLSDLLQKIASLFQNSSTSKFDQKKVVIDKRKEKSERSYDSDFSRRKLLAVSVDDEKLISNVDYRIRRDVPDISISHIPLEHDSTVPYMPQSDIHTTGIIMSTTGTDVIDGQTTEWTTVVKGTYIRGTYAHIVQSTSRIFYTIDATTDIPKMTENLSTTPPVQPTKTLQNLNPMTPPLGESEVFESVTNSLHINSKATDRLYSTKSSILFSESKVELKPTPVLHSDLDIINLDIQKHNLVTSIQSSSSSQLDAEISSNLSPIQPSETNMLNTESIADGVTELSDRLIPSSTNMINLNHESELMKEEFLSSDNDNKFLSNNVGRMLSGENVTVIPDSEISPTETSANAESDAKDHTHFMRDKFLSITSTNDSETEPKVLENIEKDSSTLEEINSSTISSQSSALIADTSSQLSEKNVISNENFDHTKDDHNTKTTLKMPELSDLTLHLDIPSSETPSTDFNTLMTTEVKFSSPSAVSISEASSVDFNSLMTTEIQFSSPSAETNEDKKTDSINSIPISIVIESTSSIAEGDSTSLLQENKFISDMSLFNTNSDSVLSSDSIVATSGVENASEVMVFLGIASTVIDSNDPSEAALFSKNGSPDTTTDASSSSTDTSEGMLSSTSHSEIKVDLVNSAMDMSDMTVLLLPSMNLDELKTLVASAQISSNVPSPSLDEYTSVASLHTSDSKSNEHSVTESAGKELRKKRDVDEMITILKPEGRIISTDARIYLTPTTHYTTYTYFTTIVKPGRGSEVISNLHVDTVVVDPTLRSGYEDELGPCCDDQIRHTTRQNIYETRYGGRPLTDDHYHIETVPYDVGRASEITHRTTFTYYTTRFRAGTSHIETRKETKTNVTPIPTAGRYSPFEIGTYYEPDIVDEPHYHTEVPYIRETRPSDITHRTTYTYYTTRFRNGVPIVETRKETDTKVTPIPTFYRPGVPHTQGVRTLAPSYTQRIDPNLYRPDSVTHRTTYTYHTTRFRDGVPIVNTREETETNVTPIPTHIRPVATRRPVHTRIIPTGVAAYPVERTAVSHDEYPRRGTDPYVTHRTTYTYYTTRLRGGDVHVDTRYVTETNLTPNPTVPYVRGTTHYNQPHYHEDTYYDSECPVCEDDLRNTPIRHYDRTILATVPRNRVRGRPTGVAYGRSDDLETGIQPSTATHYSTYTYATTQLARGGTPVVRTREHTVTEVLSDVVLPTLKFGDRIRSKRDVAAEENFSSDANHRNQNAFSPGRQGRRLDTGSRNEPENRGRNKLVASFQPKQSHPSNGVVYGNEEIKPTSITYYSTYTYFTTELGGPTPIIKTREHTVTEILTDVIVPTVSFIRKPISNSRLNSFAHRAKRSHDEELIFDKINVLQRKLLSITEMEINSTNEAINSSQPIVLDTPNGTIPNILSNVREDKITTTSVESTIMLSIPRDDLLILNYSLTKYLSDTDIIENNSTEIVNLTDSNNENGTTIENLKDALNDLSITSVPTSVDELVATFFSDNSTSSIADSQNISNSSNSSKQFNGNSSIVADIAHNIDHLKNLTKELNSNDNLAIQIKPVASTVDILSIFDSDGGKTSRLVNETVTITSESLSNSGDMSSESILTLVPNSKPVIPNEHQTLPPDLMSSLSSPILESSHLFLEDTFVSSLSTKHIGNSNSYVFHSSTSLPENDPQDAEATTIDLFKNNSNLTNLYDEEDLSAEGAEIRHSVVAVPKTYFTTYTYYATVLKPGGQREVQTNTKVVTSTYYQQPSPSTYYGGRDINLSYKKHSNENRQHSRNGRKCCDNSPIAIKPTRIYDLTPERAVARTYSVQPVHQINKPYRPSFADKVRGPFYDTHSSDRLKCPSCTHQQSRRGYESNSESKAKRVNVYDKNIARTPYLTSIPVPRASASKKRIPHKETKSVFYPIHDVKPTRVTYFSTYTYFTTELLNGSPTIRSREHTVTEILTDVVLPTVTSVPQQNTARYHLHNRGKRHGILKAVKHVSKKLHFMAKRKLLSAEENINLASDEEKYSGAEALGNLDDFESDLVIAEANIAYNSVKPTAVTYYTTHTYYKTVLKPGNKREVETSTKLHSSIYYPDIQPSRAFERNIANTAGIYQNDLNQGRCKTCHSPQNGPQTRKPYYLPSSRTQRIYHDNNYPNDKYRSISTNRNRNPQNILRDQVSKHSIIKPNPRLEPSIVTFFSTYTYFTTELGGKTPVVRSREHTVTEILSDVIVPTVAKLRPKNTLKITPTSATRDNSLIYHAQSYPSRRLLSVDENEDRNASETDPSNVSKYTNDVPGKSEEIDNENYVMSSLTVDTLDSSAYSMNTMHSSKGIKDDFLNDSQFSKAYAAYLDYIQSSGIETVIKESIQADASIYGINDIPQLSSSKAFNTEKYSIPKVTATVSQPTTKFDDENIIALSTSSAKRNGRMTKYTTTIYGTYVNGVYAQRAKSSSEILPLTDTNMPSLAFMTLQFNPSRISGLVRSIVSSKVRGPVAVHLTTEIHGMFVGGAYAQTARVFTSSQPLSSTREPFRLRLPSYTTTSPSGTRKTGLLSTRVLRSKIEGTKTLLFVSEIYGTHIGGAYAHLGTYTTRTITASSTSTEVLPIASQTLQTFHMEDLTTGLVTVSASDKIINDTTTRYHYEVYGTYLDGTYAHVPSISTETIYPLETYLHSSTINDNGLNASISGETLQSIISPTTSSPSAFIASKNSSKIGLIEASTREHVINFTTTRHIFEVHGTYLDGLYAHVPSVSVETIIPSGVKNKEEENELNEKNSLIKDNSSKFDFEILTIFSSSVEGIVPQSPTENLNSDITIFFDDPSLASSKFLIVPSEDTVASVSFISEPLANVESDESNISDESLSSASLQHIAPILLPEALRTSFSSESRNYRIKRNKPISIYIQSSFTEIAHVSKDDIDRNRATVTTPLPISAFSEISVGSSISVKKSHVSKNTKKPYFPASEYSQHIEGNSKNTYYKYNYITRDKKNLKRIKRSSFLPRIPSRNKRFGSSIVSTSARKFGSSSLENKNKFSTSNRVYSTTSRISSTKSFTISNQPSKSIPSFISRNQRPKVGLLVNKQSITSIKVTTSTSYNFLTGRSRRFGKKDVEEKPKDEEDFEASEAVAQSVTEEILEPSPTPTPKFRFRRPPKIPKLTQRVSKTSIRPTKSQSVSSRSTSGFKRLRPTLKNSNTLLNKRKISNRYSFDEIQPTETNSIETTSTKRKFTLTTTFSLSINPTAGFLSSLEDSQDGNNVQEPSFPVKPKNKNRVSNSRNRQRSSYQTIFDNDDNEVTQDIPRALPLPVFGRSRGTKRPPKFDPRTIRSTSTSFSVPSSYKDLEETSVFDVEDFTAQPIIDPSGPVTVVDVFTTTKTLAVHLGQRTSYATITTTGYSTSIIPLDRFTKFTIGGMTKTLLSAVTGLPDANLPPDKQFTVVTEILLTTTEVESSSLVAIKFGYGTRTETVTGKQILTTLATQTNTIVEEKTSAPQIQQPYPYFPNPFAPPLPIPNNDYSLSLSENSFISTQTITSTTVLPLFFNGKTILTTITSTSLTETTVVKTATVKVPQLPTAHPFVFPQPVFILPSVTTEVTVKFTAHNGERFSIVTVITVPLSINGHTRYARSVEEIDSTQTSDIFSTKLAGEDRILKFNSPNHYSPKNLQSSFSIQFGEKLIENSRMSTQSPFINEIEIETDNTRTDFGKISNRINKKVEYISDEMRVQNPLDSSDTDSVVFKSRKLLQLSENSNDDNPEINFDVNIDNDNSPLNLRSLESVDGTESENQSPPSDTIYSIDTSHVLGPSFNDDDSGRPIPSVRVIPTRRAYIRRIKPEGARNNPLDGLNEEYNFRSNPQNFPVNIPERDFSPGRRYPNDNFGFGRNIQGYPGSLPLPPQDLPMENFGPIRGAQYFAPNRQNIPLEPQFSNFGPLRSPQNYGNIRTNRPSDNFPPLRNPSNMPVIETDLRAQADRFEPLRGLPSYSPTRQSVPVRVPEEINLGATQPNRETPLNSRRPPPSTTSAPRRVIRLRRPGGPQQSRPLPENELLTNRKPIINTLTDADEEETNTEHVPTRARGPAILANGPSYGISRRPNRIRGNNENDITTNPRETSVTVPLTYYTTFTYMTTFLNGPSTAYSTREAVVSNIASETLNPRIVGLIRTRGGFTTQNGVPTAVPLGSRAQGATTTIVNLASRVQLYNSDIYYGRSTLPESLNEGNLEENDVSPTQASVSTVHITDVASLPKTYYTLFTYYYTLRDNDKSTNSQRSETISNIDSQTDPFVTQDFSSTIDNSGILTIKPDKKLINLGLRTADGTTTEVNLELKTIIKFDNVRNAVIDRGSITPTLIEVLPSTDAVFNNYLEPDDAEVQDQQTYPQTVPIQPSFSSAVDSRSRQLSSNNEATPEIPGNNRVIRTQSLRGPLRVATTVLQRPGSLRSGVFVPRPGVRVRVKPVATTISSGESRESTSPESISSLLVTNFDSTRETPDVTTEEAIEEGIEVTEGSEEETEPTEEPEPTTESGNRERQVGRKRLKITIRRSPGVSATETNSQIVRPTRTRPRFYVVTRTASPDGAPQRSSKRPVSVKVSRKLRPSSEPQYETYTKMTSVPVVFGLSTTYRNALVTSSSLVTPDEILVQPSKTVIYTYFTTTTYTVPYTVDGKATYTTLEETNSRFVTETLDPDAEISYVSTTTFDYADAKLQSASPTIDLKQPVQTLRPQVVNNQLSIGPRVNLVTKFSNGVSLIVASDGEKDATVAPSQPALTLQPTVVTDAIVMMDKDKTTFYEPRTFYTTFTFFTTFFSGGTPSISTSEQVITNVYSVPVTQMISSTQPVAEPITVLETSENVVTATYYTTHTFYATLFNGSETVVTPLEELQSSISSSTETYTITKTILPTAAATIPSEMRSTELPQPKPSTTTTSVYRTVTNFVTLFRGSESIVSPLEEIETDVLTLTLDNGGESPFIEPSSSIEGVYTTRTVQATNTHYITLFSGSESILSSIIEVEPSVITELVNYQPTTTAFIAPSSTLFREETTSSAQSVEPTFQDLVPSIRTQYTTLTYFTTLFTDSSTILSSREEIATSYITLFVPAPLPGSTTVLNQEYTPQANLRPQSTKSSTEVKPSVAPSSEILTFYTTYTYYTTLFRGTETIISDSETVVTQYVTIESTPSESVYRQSSSAPPVFPRPTLSDSVEIRVEPTTSVESISTMQEDKNKISSLDNLSNVDFDEEIQIIGVSTNIQSGEATPTIITGTPSTDSNGATHILFTDFIVPTVDETIRSTTFTESSPSSKMSSKTSSKTSSKSFYETTLFPHESSTPSSARDSASDFATTRLTDVNIATHHIALHPTTTYQSGSSQTLGIKPGAVIDLSDVLTNTNLVGNLGETIKDIVNLFAANGNRPKVNTTKQFDSSSDSSLSPPVGGVTVSNVEEPVYIPIGAIGRNTKPSISSSFTRPSGILQPSTLLTGFTPIVKNGEKHTLEADDNKNIESVVDQGSEASSIGTGTDSNFIRPTGTGSSAPTTFYISEVDGRFLGPSKGTTLQSSVPNHESDDQHQKATPSIYSGEGTSIISGLETIFFELPDGRQPPPQTTKLTDGTVSTSSIVGIETIFFDSPEDFFARGPNRLNISGATTIFGTFPPVSESTDIKESTTVSTSSGETTIFFPVPGENPQHSHPGTRYVTSVESVTLTLTLTTSSVYQTEGTPVTVTSVFTTTIPPRTFVSTIIGSRTILGTQPEPTEALQVIPTMQPSESTTTVTTTTLIFNSIATTVVRTLVIPTHGVQPTRPATGTSTDSPRLAGILLPNQRPKVSSERPPTSRKPIQLFKSGNRPTDPTTVKPGRTGPPLKLFPTKPPTTTTKKPPTTTTKKTSYRKPGKTLVPITDGCPRECNLKNKEVCKQNVDKSWSCQCRPGFFKKAGSEECRDVKSYVVLVRVLKMGGNDITYQPELDNNLSAEYKNLTTTARKAIDEAYKTSSVGDDFVSTNVIGVHQGRNVEKEGVLVNLTVQLSGEKSANEEFLKEELAQSLEASASEIDFANATIVSPIIQRVEDVQDFDECADENYNDCSRSSICVNLPGSYTCECKEGYQDLEPLLPGRICSGEIKDCDYCNNRGVCIMTEDDNKFCRCYRMYLGKQCEINGLVLAIALPIALALLILTMFCLLCGCRKLRQKRAQKPKQNNVFKGIVPPMPGTLDRKAMIMDSSSESSGEHRPHPHSYDGFGDDGVNSTMKRSRRDLMDDHISEFQVPTVLIPRAKHSHPKQMLFLRDEDHDPCSTFTTLPTRKMSSQSLICEASSMYPSFPRRQGSLSHIDQISSYDIRAAQLNELRDARLPPPARSTGQGRRRRMSLASSQGSRAAHAGSGHDYLSERGSRCHSSLGNFGLEPELWVSRDRSSVGHSEFMNEVSMPPSSVNTRQRVWSETGRSCDETTIRASLKNIRGEYMVPGSRPPSSRRIASDDQSLGDGEDLMNMSFNDTLLRGCSNPNYEKLPGRSERNRKSKRHNHDYHCYDNPTSLNDELT